MRQLPDVINAPEMGIVEMKTDFRSRLEPDRNEVVGDQCHCVGIDRRRPFLPPTFSLMPINPCAATGYSRLKSAAWTATPDIDDYGIYAQVPR